VLIRYLASASLLLHYEQVHSLIFGSQIILLKRLNEVRSVGRTFAYVEAHFVALQQVETAFQDWDWTRYVEFLKWKKLVIESDGSLFITPMGGEYLSWIATMGRAEDRPL